VAAAVRQDVPIYASGLGGVQALNTVPIHSQVDSQLIKIAFTEGQHVKAGDVLAKIDPRLFQAALDQAVSKKGPRRRQLGFCREGSVTGQNPGRPQL
jgi:membrane fusion protein, multidrug efflux system